MELGNAATMDTNPNASAPNTSDDEYLVGYKKPPKTNQFQKGQSGNTKGRPKKNRNDLIELFEARLNENIKITGRKRGGVTKLQYLIRNLVETAAKGDWSALSAVIKILESRKDEKIPEPDWMIFCYADYVSNSTKKVDEAFFREQDKKLAEMMRQMKAGGSVKGMLEKELGRKVPVTREDGSEKKVTMREIIVARFLKVAKDEPSALKLLLKIIPDKKFVRDRTFVEVLRPTRDDIEEMQRWEWKPDFEVPPPTD